MPRAVIFDVDGTLVDTVDLHAQAWSDAFQEFGYPVHARQVRPHIGKGGDQLMPVFLDGDAIASIGEQLEHVRTEIFKKVYRPQARAFPSVKELFARVRTAGMKIGLASSCKSEELDHYLALAGIADLVTAATTADDVQRSKPFPDVFCKILDKLGAQDPAAAVVVGDSPYDAQGAAKAGILTVGLLSGGFHEDDLRSAGCIALYSDPEDLLRHFDQSPLSSVGEQAVGRPSD